MKKRIYIFILFPFFLLVMSGCLDSIELNEQAFVLGVGVDLTESGEYLISAQIIIPSAIGSGESGGQSQETSFFVETGRGENLIDADENLQSKLSRRYNRRQRQTIYVGERLAKHGIKDSLDILTRESDIPLGGDYFVIKGAQALDVLKVRSPLEAISATASLKMHEQTNIDANNTILNFLITNASQSMSCNLPALKLEKEQNTMQPAGSAVFNKKLKLIGFLNEEETKDKLWIDGNLYNQVVSVSVPQEKRTINVELSKLKSHIHPIIN
ncbi:Ger(x)C family spore germination protein, partial [Priestia megaterium]